MKKKLGPETASWGVLEWTKYFNEEDFEADLSHDLVIIERRFEDSGCPAEERCEIGGVDLEDLRAFAWGKPTPPGKYWEEGASVGSVPPVRSAVRFILELEDFNRRGSLDDDWREAGYLAARVGHEIWESHALGYSRRRIVGTLLRLDRARTAAQRAVELVWTKRSALESPLELARIYATGTRLLKQLSDWSSYIKS